VFLTTPISSPLTRPKGYPIQPQAQRFHVRFFRPAVNPVGKDTCTVRPGAAKLPHWNGEFSPAFIVCRSSIMLRLALLGLLIPVGVGMLAAMELNTPARHAGEAAQPVAETIVGISDSPGVLAKADKLEVAAASSEPPAPVTAADERVAPPENVSIAASEPPRVIKRHRPDIKPKKVAAAAPSKAKPKKADVKLTTVAERRKPANDSVFCRLSAFGGLRKALNSADCEI